MDAANAWVAAVAPLSPGESMADGKVAKEKPRSAADGTVGVGMGGNPSASKVLRVGRGAGVLVANSLSQAAL